ncbi:MAG: PRC-barrel domain-containing protein [Longimicrobiales bacterium]
MVFKDDRSRRDQAGVGPDPSYVAGDLVPMRELSDFRFAAGEPDVRGWEVCTLTGQQIGRVEDVLIDPRRGQVVLLDVDLREEAGNREVPLRAVQLDRVRGRVIVDRSDVTGFEATRTGRPFSDDDRTRLESETREGLNRDLRYDRDLAENEPGRRDRMEGNIDELIDDDDRLR